MRTKILMITLVFFASVVSGYGEIQNDFTLARFLDQSTNYESTQGMRQNNFVSVQKGNPISGISFKYGWTVSPEFKLFSEFWLASVAVDFAVAKVLSIGLEVQPHFDSLILSAAGTNYKATTIQAMAFVNAKFGFSFSRLTIFVGGGPGINFSYYTDNLFEGDNSELLTKTIYHLLGGIQINLGSLVLIAELNMINFRTTGDLQEDPWLGYLMFGIRL